MPLTAYEVRARPILSRLTEWTAWTAVTTPDARLVRSDLADALRGAIDMVDGWAAAGVTDLPGAIVGLGGRIREVRDWLAGIEAGVVDGRAQSWLAQQQLGGQLARAELHLAGRIDTTSEGLSIVAAALLAVEAQLPGLASSEALLALASRVTTTETGITALAEALMLVETVTGRFAASGLFRVSAVTAPAGAAAMVALTAAAAEGDETTSEAGLYLTARTDGGSDVLIKSDRFAVLTASGQVAPFAVVGDSVHMTNVNISGQLIQDGALMLIYDVAEDKVFDSTDGSAQTVVVVTTADQAAATTIKLGFTTGRSEKPGGSSTFNWWLQSYSPSHWSGWRDLAGGSITAPIAMDWTRDDQSIAFEHRALPAGSIIRLRINSFDGRVPIAARLIVEQRKIYS